MYLKDVDVPPGGGIHARNATLFVMKADEFRSSVWLEYGGKRVNAKALLHVLGLDVKGGTTIRLIADGVDDVEAVSEVAALVERDFEWK